MIYNLKNCRNGNDAVYNTTVDISLDGTVATFIFVAENSEYFCPYHNYNDIHSAGDACEILIGTDPNREYYYEIEISPENKQMVAKMKYCGEDENKEPILEIDFVKNSFVKSEVTKTEKGYTATVSFDLSDIQTGEGEVYFNAYRLETDGGESEKHLFALFPTNRNRFHVPTFYRFLKDFV